MTQTFGKRALEAMMSLDMNERDNGLAGARRAIRILAEYVIQQEAGEAEGVRCPKCDATNVMALGAGPLGMVPTERLLRAGLWTAIPTPSPETGAEKALADLEVLFEHRGYIRRADWWEVHTAKLAMLVNLARNAQSREAELRADYEKLREAAADLLKDTDSGPHITRVYTEKADALLRLLSITPEDRA